MKRTYFFLILIILISACKSNEERYSSYFNVASALRADIAILNREKAFLVKTVRSDGKVDNIKNKKPDWNLELELFQKLSISGSDMEGKYKVDTSLYYPIKNDSAVLWKRVSYTALDENLTVRLLEVEYDSKKNIRSITGNTISSDFMTTINKSFTYYPFKSYEVSATETTTWFGTSTYKVEGVIFFADPYFE
jgi:hypothetical protein